MARWLEVPKCHVLPLSEIHTTAVIKMRPCDLTCYSPIRHTFADKSKVRRNGNLTNNCLPINE